MHTLDYQRAIDNNKNDELRWQKMKWKGNYFSWQFQLYSPLLNTLNLKVAKTVISVQVFSVFSDKEQQGTSLYQIFQFVHFLPLFEKIKHDQVF